MIHFLFSQVEFLFGKRLSASLGVLFFITASSAALICCSSGPSIKQQGYAKLKCERTFENEFPAVWKAVQETWRNYSIAEQSPEQITPAQMRTLPEATLQTNWIYGQSRDKYHEYQVNGSPRKIYLQTRFRLLLKASRVLGGVEIKIDSDEEIERLHADGASAGYESTSEPDTSRCAEMLDKVGLALHSQI